MAKRGRARRAASAAGRGARALGKWSVQGAKGSAAAGAAGVVAYVAMKMACGNNADGKPRLEIAQKHLVATPIVMGIGGHFLKRRYQSLGAGVVGASAALAALAFDQDRALKANKAANETQALTQPGDIRALTQPGDIRELDDALDTLETQGAGDEGAGLYELGEAATIGM